MKNFIAAIALLSTGIVGCSSLGLAQPQNLDQGIAYAYGGLTTALQGIATATNAGQLTAAQATNANAMALNVKNVLDTARSLEVSNATAAANDLTLATSALTSLQSYLKTSGVAK
jgi:hypothetical protein